MPAKHSALAKTRLSRLYPRVSSTYPIGIPDQPWGATEKQQWLERQVIQRSYETDVVTAIGRLTDRYDVERYGALSADSARYPLFVLRTPSPREGRPTILVTGGVHGYETSGVHGALRFLEREAESFAHRFDIVVAPCLSPWAYETINRWNPDCVDPNRSFFENSGSPEATQLMAWLQRNEVRPLAHFDLHETTDTDNTEFRPALAARDGRPPEDLGPIPPGFYLVDDTSRPQPAFQSAIIAAVEPITAIAPPDEQGHIIGCPLQAPGVIHYDKRELYLCGGVTDARFVTTTEVYPDAPGTDAETCIVAQVAAVRGGLEYLLQ